MDDLLGFIFARLGSVSSEADIPSA